MQDSRRTMPAVLDRHIETEDQDAFGHRHYAQALRCLIEDEGHRPPFSIGLLGGWGTGKSSVKELYTRALADDTSKDTKQHPRSQRFKSITFNAWRFGGKEQDIKRALLRHVFLELGGDEGKLQDELYRNVTHTESVTKSISELTWQHLISWAAPVPAFLIAFFTYLLVVCVGLAWLPLNNWSVQAAFVLAATGIYGYLIKVMKPSSVSPFNTVTRVHLPSVTAEQYEELLLQQLRKFKPARGNAVPYERLVIFVDDLDRLSAEEMVLGLDAVRTFMEIPTDKLPKNLGLVFVISCDEGKVADALSRRRGNPEQPGSIFNPTDARRYLDRIFQFRLEIPPPPRNDMRQFALSKLKAFPDIVSQVSEKGASVEQVVDRMIHANVTDPRNALQIVNAFTQTWWLARAREQDAIGSDLPGGLHEGAVTNHPIPLGALSAARVSFPGFYRDLQDDPQLLLRLTSLMVKHTPLRSEPMESRHVLKRYVEEDGDGKTILVEGNRELRQFLSSLVGIHWPDSLQSLLLLSEDFVTRQYGGQASRIYGYLVSGDTQGFLEALSPRANDFLSDQEAQLLHGMLSELHRTEETLKFNAMRVVADVIGRLPPRTRTLILGILCNDIVTSRDLRSLLGIEKIARITEVAGPTDQQHIASVLVEELLVSDQKITMRLPSGQAPNLNEAVEMAKGAAGIVLSVFAAHGLPYQAKVHLTDWVCERTVMVDIGAVKLSFIELQHWVDTYEEALLHEIGPRYIDQLTTELRRFEEKAEGFESLDSLDMRSIAARVDSVWARLASEGEESRSKLWEQVANLAEAHAPEVTDSVMNAVESYAPYAQDEQLLECLTRFSHRVSRFEKAPLDYGRAFRLLVDKGAERLDHFNDEYFDDYASLSIELARINGCGDDAAEVFRTFIVHNTRALNSVASAWIEEPLTNVPSVCRRQLFASYGALPEEAQEALADSLTNLTDSSELDEDDGAVYLDAAENLPAESWGDAYLQLHLDQLLPKLSGRVGSWDEYLSQILPGLSQVFVHTSPGVLGPALQALFSGARSYKDTFDPLHGHFVGRWPSVEKLSHGYAPQTIFGEVMQTANSSPGFVGRNALASMKSMLVDKVVPETLAISLVEVACVVWRQRPAEAVDLLSTGKEDLSAAQVADLVDTIDVNDDEEIGLLGRVWGVVVPNQSAASDLDVTKAVLLKGKRGTVNDPDLAFAMWCSALGDEAHSNLRKLLLDAATNDEQRARLFSQITRNIGFQDDAELKEIPGLALKLFQTGDSPLAWAAVKSRRPEIDKLLHTQEERLGLARLLLNELQSGASETAKGYMAEWAKSLGTEAVLKDVDPLRLSERELDIISSVFGSSRSMSGLRRRWSRR
ncbi:P-loop NTPase fold protein [Pseudomonas sp. LABIM340]|uniref:KAP family P-loop NTPase fold protein n=1 Tax=Pseudomonas sp. LABIM340 TaxID=3156585 RepID=UPI0032AEFAF7